MRIRWTEPAFQDLIRIGNYLEEHASSIVAERVTTTIYEMVDSLAEFPRRGRPGRKAGTRELVILRLPYVAIYRTHQDTLDILRILHGAQQWP